MRTILRRRALAGPAAPRLPTTTADDTSSRDLASLYVDHHAWLKAWLRRRLGCSEQAAELAHDTFLRLLGARAQPQALDAPRAYLTTTARRLLVDRLRRQEVERAYLAGLAAMGRSEAGAPSPEAVLAAVQALTRFSEALQALPPKGREAFLLHYLEGESQAAVAERLQLSVRMVQKYLAQGLVRCQLALDGGL